MALLPGIDPRNRNQGRNPGWSTRPTSSSSPTPTPLRTNTSAIPGLPGAWAGVQRNTPVSGYSPDGRYFTPNANQNNPLQRSDGSTPPLLYGAGNETVTYNGETLFRNEGPLVGVNPNSGVAIYTQNGRLRDFQAYGNPANSWSNFDALKSATSPQIAQVQQLLVDAGLLAKGDMTVGRYDVATQGALYVAMQEANRLGVSWDKYASMIANGEFGAGADGSNKLGPGDSYTQTQIRYTTRETAMGLIEQAIQQELGRAPTSGETARFLRELRAEEKANPIVTTTTLGEGNDTTSVTEGGVDAGAWSQVYVDDVKPKKQQRYKEAVYENALMRMLGDGSL